MGKDEGGFLRQLPKALLIADILKLEAEVERLRADKKYTAEEVLAMMDNVKQDFFDKWSLKLRMEGLEAEIEQLKADKKLLIDQLRTEANLQPWVDEEK